MTIQTPRTKKEICTGFLQSSQKHFSKFHNIPPSFALIKSKWCRSLATPQENCAIILFSLYFNSATAPKRWLRSYWTSLFNPLTVGIFLFNYFSRIFLQNPSLPRRWTDSIFAIGKIENISTFPKKMLDQRRRQIPKWFSQKFILTKYENGEIHHDQLIMQINPVSSDRGIFFPPN